jgi:hypothetical protein
VLHTKCQAECPSLSVPLAPNYSHPSIRLATKTQVGIHSARVPFLILSAPGAQRKRRKLLCVYVCLSPATPCNFTEYSSVAWLGAERERENERLLYCHLLGCYGNGQAERCQIKEIVSPPHREFLCMTAKAQNSPRSC